jgi:hypothetical protein
MNYRLAATLGIWEKRGYLSLRRSSRIFLLNFRRVLRSNQVPISVVIVGGLSSLNALRFISTSPQNFCDVVLRNTGVQCIVLAAGRRGCEKPKATLLNYTNLRFCLTLLNYTNHRFRLTLLNYTNHRFCLTLFNFVELHESQIMFNFV